MNKYTKISILGSSEWSLVFCVDEQGNEPVKEFLAGLDLKTQKKTQKTPRREIDIAIRRMKDFVQRYTQSNEEKVKI